MRTSNRQEAGSSAREQRTTPEAVTLKLSIQCRKRLEEGDERRRKREVVEVDTSSPSASPFRLASRELRRRMGGCAGPWRSWAERQTRTPSSTSDCTERTPLLPPDPVCKGDQTRRKLVYCHTQPVVSDFRG